MEKIRALTEKQTTLDTNDKVSLLWRIILPLVLSLLVMNDFIPLWEPWEVLNMERAKAGAENLPQLIYSLIFGTQFPSLFWLRLPGVVLLLGGLGLAYRWGKDIFGDTTRHYAALVLATSFLVLFCGKLAINDSWLFVFQLLAALAMLRFLKQAQLSWAVLFWLPALLALATHPWSTAVALTVLGIYLRFLHPQGKQLDKLGYWILPVVLIFSEVKTEGFLLTYGAMAYWKFLGLSLLGFLPWTGFMVGSFADWFYKFRKKEEMSIIIGGIFLAGLAAQSLLLSLALAFLIGRQLTVYFDPNFPYRSLTRAFAILHLLFSFFLISGLLLTAYSEIGAIGFRSVMLVGIAYWAFSFIGIIGIFGDQKKMILWGLQIGAQVAFIFFWVQAYSVFAPWIHG